MATAARPRLLVPGLVPYDPARETYRVRPGAATLVALEPDDRLTVRDLHGAQRAELTVLAAAGGEDLGALGARRERTSATVLRALACSPADGAAAIVAPGREAEPWPALEPLVPSFETHPSFPPPAGFLPVRCPGVLEFLRPVHHRQPPSTHRPLFLWMIWPETRQPARFPVHRKGP